jgi:hypothetical protein
MSSGGPSVLTDVVAAFAYDLEAGRADALERVAGRLDSLRRQLASSRGSILRSDSIRAARQLQKLTHPLEQFAGSYENPSFGRIVFTVQTGRLQYRWGDVYGPAEIYDASADQMRIEIVGSGNVVSFVFPTSGPASSVSLQGVQFNRVP